MAHFDNLASILTRGLLSHNRARQFRPTSIANPDVQAERQGKKVPGGLALHDYVNIYFNGRNAMLSDVLFRNRQEAKHLRVAVISVSTDVLDLPGAVISDRNAAARLARFDPSPDGVRGLDQGVVFARYWTDPDKIVMKERKERMMAELLVPHRVDPAYLRRFYVCCSGARAAGQALGLGLTFTVKPYIFFNDGARFHD